MHPTFRLLAFKSFAGFLAASLSLVGLSSAQSLPLGDYIAMQDGTWNYATAGGGSPVINVTGTTLERVTTFAPGIHLTSCLELTNDGLIIAGEVSTLPGDEYSETDNPVSILLPPTLVVNGADFIDLGTYSGTSPGGGYSGTRSITTEVENFENISVSAGIFSALKVIATVVWDEGAGENGTTVNTFWLAKGRGVVQMRYQTSAGFDETFGLISSPARPSSPTGGSATSQVGSVLLSWPKVGGADEYRVWRSASNSFASATQLGTVAQPGGLTASFTDSTTVGDTPYFYFLETLVGTAPSLSSSSIAGAALTENDFGAYLDDAGLTGSDRLVDADPNYDGIQNGVAYALGIQTTGTPTASEKARLPQSTGPSEGNHPIFKVILPEVAPGDVIYRIETIVDLSSGPWTQIATKTGDGAWSGPASVSEGVPSGGFVCVEVEGLQTVSAAPLCFMRLRVEVVE